MTPDLGKLESSFSGRLLTSADDMQPFLTDWRRKWTGAAIAVAQPDTTDDVAAVMRWCHTHRVPVVPHGGNTGLSGAATPDASGESLVLSTARLKNIRKVDKANDTITVEAGVTLLDVQKAARAEERLFPLSLAAEGSCTIGGNLATNAGGVQVLRYGNARELCLGLEVVTCDGRIWDGLRGLRKDNSGYSLRDLFIGAEGTLGIITAAVLKLFPLPAAQVAAFAAVPTPAAAVELLQRCQAKLGASLTAFELVGQEGLALVEKHVSATRRPLDDESPWYVLIEVSDAESEEHARAAIEAVLMASFEDELISDAALSSSISQFNEMWALRENVSESQGAEGPTIKHDIAIPISGLAKFIEQAHRDIATRYPELRQVVFGHLGDGNLHYNLSPPAQSGNGGDKQDFAALEAPVNKLVHDLVVNYGGSISAEHGLGVLRRDEAQRYKASVELDIMRAIKSALDPFNLMNPGKVMS
jgi:FAD/FMN-containing dehydrogenase